MPRRSLLPLLSVLAACGDAGGYDPGPQPPLDGFVFVVDQSSITRTIGGSGLITYYARCDGTDASAIPIVVAGLPEGVTSAAPTTSARGGGSVRLDLADDLDPALTAVDPVELTLTATCRDATLVREVELWLLPVPELGVFFAENHSTSLTIQVERPSNRVDVSFVIERVGSFLGPVTFSIPAPPTGLTFLPEDLGRQESSRTLGLIPGPDLGDVVPTITLVASYGDPLQTTTLQLDLQVVDAPRFDSYGSDGMILRFGAPTATPEPTSGVGAVAGTDALRVVSNVTPSAAAPYVVVSRHDLASGAIDEAVGTDGFVSFAIGADPTVAHAVTGGDDGSLFVVGETGSPSVGFVAHLRTDGTLDPDFGSAGVQTLDLGDVTRLTAITRLSGDAALYVGGEVSVSGNVRAFERKLALVDGAIDPVFTPDFGAGGRDYTLSQLAIGSSILYAVGEYHYVPSGPDPDRGFAFAVDTSTGEPVTEVLGGGVYTQPSLPFEAVALGADPGRPFVLGASGFRLLAFTPELVDDEGAFPGLGGGVSDASALFVSASGQPFLFGIGQTPNTGLGILAQRRDWDGSPVYSFAAGGTDYVEPFTASDAATIASLAPGNGGVYGVGTLTPSGGLPKTFVFRFLFP